MEKARWELIKSLAKQGRLDDIESKVFVSHYRTLQAIAKDYQPPVEDAEGTTGFWFYGEAGSGKSRTARQQYPGAYIKNCNKWWDGYQGQEAVIIDDVDTTHSCLGHHFKLWADRYAFQAEVKGGSRMIRPKAVVITSQYHPNQIWQDEETLAAINRRFKLVKFSVLAERDST